MISINSIDSSLKHLNFLQNKEYVNTTELNITNYLDDNFYIHLGYFKEKEIFNNLIHKIYSDDEDIFIHGDIDRYVINNGITYYNKYYIDNPHTDLFLKSVRIRDSIDLSKENVCDLNISKLLNNKINFYLFHLELIRNLYYFVSSTDYIDGYDYDKNTYTFELPTKYFVSDRNNIIKNNYNKFFKFSVIVYEDKLAISFNYDLTITDNFIESVKPLLNFHLNVIVNDSTLKLKNVNKPEEIKTYARNIFKKYDEIRFKVNVKLLNYLHYKYFNSYTEAYINNYLSIIVANYNSFNLITNDNLTKYDISSTDENGISDIIIEDPDYNNENNENKSNENSEVPIIIDNKIDKNIVSNNDEELIFDDISENNEIHNTENKIVFYKKVILSIIVFLSIISIFIVTYLFIKILSSTFNIFDAILTFTIIVLIFSVITLIVVYSSDNYLKKFFFLNKEEFIDFNRDDLKKIFDMFKEVSRPEQVDPPPIENTEDEEVPPLPEDTQDETEQVIEEVKEDITENLEQIKETENEIGDTKEAILDLEIESEEMQQQIENEEFKLESYNTQLDNQKETLSQKQNQLGKEEEAIQEYRNKLEQYGNEKKDLVEKFTNYMKDSYDAQQAYNSTLRDLQGKMDVMDSVNKLSYLNLDEMFSVSNSTDYFFGEEITAPPSTEEDDYMQYNDEEIRSYNYITDIKDLEKIIKGYNLDEYLTVKENLLEFNLDLKRLNTQILDELNTTNMDAIENMDNLLKKINMAKNLVKISKMLAAINMNKKINLEVTIETNENELENAIEIYKANYDEIIQLKNSISNETEIKNKISEDIKSYQKNIEKITEDLLKLQKNLEDKEKIKNDYKMYYDYSLDKLKQINLQEIEKNLENKEKIKNIELYEITNLQLFESDKSIELINNKYKIIDENDEQKYIINEYKLEIDNKYKNIESNYEKQIQYFTKLKQENVKHDIFKIKIENKKASLDSGKQINMEHNLTYNSQIKAITELLENDKTEKEQIIKILFTKKNLIEAKNDEKNNIELRIAELRAMKIDTSDDRYINASRELENVRLELTNLNREFNSDNVRKDRLKENIKNNTIELNSIERRKENSNKIYKQLIDKNQGEYELLLIQENFNLRKKNMLLIELSKNIQNMNNDKETIVVVMNKKIELIRKNNDMFKTKFSILIKDKKFLETEKAKVDKIFNNLLDQTCLIFNKFDDENKIECKKENLEQINNKINELLDSNLINDEVLKNKLISIKTNNTLILNKSYYIRFLLLKYNLDIATNTIKHLVREIEINEYEIDLNNINLDKQEFTILFKNIYQKTLENEKVRIEKLLKQYSDKKFNYQKFLQNIEESAENYKLRKNLENKIEKLIKNIEHNESKLTKFTNYIESLTKEIKHLNETFLKLKDDINFKNNSIAEKKFQKIELLSNTFSEYYTLISDFVTFKSDNKSTLSLSKYIFVPIILTDSIKKKIYDIFNENELEFKKYIKNDVRYEKLKKMVENISNIVVINKDSKIKSAKILIKFNINYDIFDDKTYNIDKFKIDITQTLSNTLGIEKKYINIISITNSQNVMLNVNIETNEKYKTEQSIVDFLVRQVSNSNSELKKQLYGNDITEIISNINKIEELIFEKKDCDSSEITYPNYVLGSKDDYFDSIFNYCNYENMLNEDGTKKISAFPTMLLYLPLVTKSNPLDYTLMDYSPFQKSVYEAMCEGNRIKSIYYNYIELDNTLLKVDNINLINRNKYTISFITNLKETNENKQHVLLSNGKIYQTFNLGLNSNSQNKINWELYHDGSMKTFQNNNIWSIGFIDNKLYIKLPCSNGKDYTIITDDDSSTSQPSDGNSLDVCGDCNTSLYVNSNEWCHWIIVRNENKITIYKNKGTPVCCKDITINENSDNGCYVENDKYDRETLYIGGIKTDLDSNTKMLNNLVSFKGLLKDLRIYDSALTSTLINQIFINCSTTEQTEHVDVEEILGGNPELADDSYIENTEPGYTGSTSLDGSEEQVVTGGATGNNNYEISERNNTNNFSECGNKFMYLRNTILTTPGDDLCGEDGGFECIKDNYPCLNEDDISYIDNTDQTNPIKYCYTNSETPINNTVNNEMFVKAKDLLNIYKRKNGASYLNNFKCGGVSEKLIFSEENEEWICEDTDFTCHNNNYMYQLPVKKSIINGEETNTYDCISKNTGIYRYDLDKYECYNNLKNNSIE